MLEIIERVMIGNRFVPAGGPGLDADRDCR